MKYKVHFTDNYGSGTIECKDEEQFNKVLANVQNDPNCEDIWCEYYDAEEGWQA